MKHRLFKKFHTLDSNDYYVAKIHDEIYYGVSTVYRYKLRFLGVSVPMKEEESFVTVKVPESIIAILREIERNPDIPLHSARDNVQNSIIGSLAKHELELLESLPEDMRDSDTAKNIKRSYAVLYDRTYKLFEHDWVSPFVHDNFINRNYSFLCTVYNGLASREVWYGRKYEDAILFHGIKLFGNAKDSDVVGMNRILMDKELLTKFLAQISDVNPETESE